MRTGWKTEMLHVARMNATVGDASTHCDVCAWQFTAKDQMRLVSAPSILCCCHCHCFGGCFGGCCCHCLLSLLPKGHWGGGVCNQWQQAAMICGNLRWEIGDLVASQRRDGKQSQVPLNWHGSQMIWKWFWCSWPCSGCHSTLSCQQMETKGQRKKTSKGKSHLQGRVSQTSVVNWCA